MPDRRAERWTGRLARHRTGLAAMSFAESTLVPIPLETIIAPLMVGEHRHATTIAMAVWLGCLAGAALFFTLGAWLAEPVVLPVLDWIGLRETFERLIDEMGRDGLFWTIFLVSFSPAPMQIATLGAGAAHGNFLVFMAAIAASRGARYFGLALLAKLFGPKIADLNIPTGRLVLGALIAGLAIWGAAQLLGP